MALSALSQSTTFDKIPLETFSEDLPIQPSPEADTYNIYYTTSRCNATLHLGDADSPAQYYAEWKATKLFKPQIYFRKGDSKKSPVFGAGKIQWGSKNMLVAHGDYENHPESVAWQELHREKGSLRCSNWDLLVEDAETGGQMKLLWRKDRSHPGATVYACEDEQGRVLARLRSGGALNWKKGGELDVAREIGEGLKEWLLISGLSVWVWEALDYQSLLSGFDKKGHEKKA